MDEVRAVIHLKSEGLIKVFRVITPEDDRLHRVAHDLQVMGLQRLLLVERSWVIEKYHQGANHFVVLSATRSVLPRLNAILSGWLYEVI